MSSAVHDPRRLIAYGCLALSMSLVGAYVALSKPLVAAFPVLLLAWRLNSRRAAAFSIPDCPLEGLLEHGGNFERGRRTKHERKRQRKKEKKKKEYLTGRTRTSDLGITTVFTVPRSSN